jgi:hypothetical protein
MCIRSIARNRWLSSLFALLIFVPTASIASAGDDIFCDGFESTTFCFATPFWVLPNRVSALATTSISIYFSSDVSASSLDLVGPSSQIVPLSFSGNPTYANRVDALVPTGLAAGLWSVQATDGNGNVGLLSQALTVTNSTSSLALSAITPSVASTFALTRANLTASGFVAMPEVFLQPSGSAAQAIRVDDREFVSGTDVSISIPAGLGAGSYDVIAINPDGSTGVLSSGLAVVASFAPQIDKLVPASSVASIAQQVILQGVGFGSSAPTVSASCVDSSGLPQVPISGVVGSSSATSVSVTFNFASLPSNSECRIDLTTIDGLITSFSNLPVLSPAASCIGGPSSIEGTLQQGRRGGVLLSGPSTPEGRRLYMIGGDTGTTTGALSSVESAAVDSLGNLSAFRYENYALPQVLTFSGGVRVGDYLYLVGGNNGTSQEKVAYRSRVLRDQRTPAILDLDAIPASSGSGLAAGLWSYRVSPQFPGIDPDNPNGEGLPGGLLDVELPALPAGTQLTIVWNAVSGVSGYAIYRSPTVGTVGTYELLANVSAGTTSYVDTGSATTPGQIPLPLGSLANWRLLPTLNTAREAPAVVSAPDPVTANRWYVYGIAGRDSAVSVVGSYEFLSVDIQPDGSQTLGSNWTSGSMVLPTPRYQLGAWAMGPDDVPAISSGTYVYAGPGSDASASAVKDVNVGLVASGGDLGSWVSVKNVTGGIFGASTAQDLGCMFLIGGANGAPSTGIVEGLVSSSPPTLTATSWNSTGILLQRGRVYAGATSANGFIFIAGGQSSAPSPADNSVERIEQ